MNLLVTGAAGFVGSTLIRRLLASTEGLQVVGLDNLSRPGSESNRTSLEADGVRFVHGDLRQTSDLDALAPVDWVLDAAAMPSVLGGVGDARSSRQVVEHNLIGTINLLELCKRQQAGLVLLSSSRVYGLAELQAVPLVEADGAFVPDPGGAFPAGIGPAGVTEACSTAPPVSLYGSTKLASEQLALEYSAAFDFPVWIDRCGVLAGPGQFGTAEQGIFSYWVHAHRAGRALGYIGYGGRGLQVRDGLHAGDLAALVAAQMAAGDVADRPRVVNVAGGAANALSLSQLTAWCADRFGPVPIEARPETRAYDVPWVILDASRAEEVWTWQPTTPLTDVLEEIAVHAEAHPDWLTTTGG